MPSICRTQVPAFLPYVGVDTRTILQRIERDTVMHALHEQARASGMMAQRGIGRFLQHTALERVCTSAMASWYMADCGAGLPALQRHARAFLYAPSAQLGFSEILIQRSVTLDPNTDTLVFQVTVNPANFATACTDPIINVELVANDHLGMVRAVMGEAAKAYPASYAEVLRRSREDRLLMKKRRRGEDLKNQRIGRRAKRLLNSCLNVRQRAELRSFGWFRVTVGERTYRIKSGSSGNVELLGTDGRAVEKYCIHPKEWLPIHDVMLAQKLLLEADEAQFLATANKSRPWGQAPDMIPGVPAIPPEAAPGHFDDIGEVAA